MKNSNILILLVSILLITSCNSNNPGDYIYNPQFVSVRNEYLSGRFIVRDGDSERGQLKIIDKSGQIMLEPDFDDITGFSNDELSGFQINGKWGFFDKNGLIVIEPIFDYVSVYGFDDNGLIAVEIEGKWGFIDTNGKIVIDAKYDFVATEGFSRNGLVAVKFSNGGDEKWGYINKLGHLVISPKFSSAQNFSENGLAAVKDSNSKKWGYIDSKGRYIIKPQFSEAQIFSQNGLAAVKIGSESGMWGFINASGDFVINPSYSETYSFVDDYYGGNLDLAAVKIGEGNTGKWGFIDSSNNFVIPPKFTEVKSFFYNSELAAAKIDNINGGKWGFIDKTGKYVIHPKFDEVGYFNQEGLAPVRLGSSDSARWGFITDGRSKSIATEINNWISSLKAPQCDDDEIISRIEKSLTEDKKKKYQNGFGENKPWLFEINNFGLTDVVDVGYIKSTKTRICKGAIKISVNLVNAKYSKFIENSEINVSYEIAPNKSLEGEWVVSTSIQENVSTNEKKLRGLVSIFDRDAYCKLSYKEKIRPEQSNYNISEISHNPRLYQNIELYNDLVRNSGDRIFSRFSDKDLVSAKYQIEKAKKINPGLESEDSFFVSIGKNQDQRVFIKYSDLLVYMSTYCFKDSKNNSEYFNLSSGLISRKSGLQEVSSLSSSDGNGKVDIVLQSTSKSSEEWKRYLVKVISKIEYQDLVSGSTYPYFLPINSKIVDRSENGKPSSPYLRQLGKVKQLVSRNNSPGNLFVFGSPDSKTMSDLINEAFLDGNQGALNGSYVLFVGDIKYSKKVQDSAERLGAIYLFEDAK